MKPWLMLSGGTCRAARRRLSEAIDAELAPAQAARLARHVAWCRRCRRVSLTLAETVARLGALAADAAPPWVSVADAVVARLDDPAPPDGSRRRR